MKRFNNMIFIFSSLISTLFLLTACSKQEIQFQETETYSTLESVTEQVEDIETRPEVAEEQEMEDSANQLEVYHPIDYEELEKNHVIFKENICEEPHSVYDNSYLCEQLSAEIEMTEKAITEYGYPGGAELDYFTFDFNDDGEEEYVVSFNGAGWNGSSGNLVEIYEKADNGNLKEIYTVIAEVYSHNGEYWPIAILEEKTNGYYDFVLPWSNNRIWKYNAETDQYCSLDIYEQYIINRQGIGSQIITESLIETETTETLKISINDWGNISIDRLKMVDWYYEKPEKVYDWAESSGSWAENTYKGRTQIDSQYTFNDIDFGQFHKRNNIQNPDYYSELEERYSSPAFCWRVSVSWVYNKESGIVSVDDIKLLPTLAY